MGRKIRWIELGKDLVILLLIVSAGVLLSLSPLVRSTGLLDRLTDAGEADSGDTGAAQSIPSAAIPVRMTVCTEFGLYGVQYDQAAVDSLFAGAGTLLGEALDAAGEPVGLSAAMAGAGERRLYAGRAELSADERQWRALLAGPHVSFGYAEAVPLAALGGWLKTGSACRLESSARNILLASFSDGTVALCWQDTQGGFYLSPTGLDASLHLLPILNSVAPNNAFFAFEDENLPAALDPYTLFSGQSFYAPVYLSANPVPITDNAQASRLLSALSFSDINRAETSDSVLYVEGDDTVRMYAGGLIRGHITPGRYASAPGLSGAVECAWQLASAALEPLCGEARLYLLSAVEEGEGFTVSFGYTLNGCQVALADRGRAAQFVIQNGYVTDFTLYLRSYSAADRNTLLLPAEKAAAALAALTDDAHELTVQYQDGGGAETEPCWMGD